MKTEIINFKRMGFMLRRQWALSAKSWKIALLASVGINIAISLLILFTSGAPEAALASFRVSLLITLIIVGLVYTALSFKELQDSQNAVSYLTLPATTLEKYLTAWLFSFPIYIILGTIVFEVTYFLMAVIAFFAYGFPLTIVPIFTTHTGLFLLVAFIIHSIFFLGAAWFKKLSFFKTLLVLFVISIANDLWAFILGSILLPVNGFTKHEFAFNGSLFINNEQFGHTVVTALMLFMTLIAVLSLVTAYFKLKEREG
jgi:hypothetical protein